MGREGARDRPQGRSSYSGGGSSIYFAIIVLEEGKTDAWATQGGPLHEAVKSGDPTAIAAALDAGADIEEQDKGSQSSFPGHS